MGQQRLKLSYRRGGLRTDHETPPPKPDNSWHGVRQFWTRAYDGLYSNDYDRGVTDAQADLDEEVTTRREALLSTSSANKDKAWEAYRDGFEDTLRKNDGTTLR
jgi:hypothetical protein